MNLRSSKTFQAIHGYLGGFGIFALIILVLPGTIWLLVQRRWSLAAAWGITGLLCTHIAGVEDRKKEAQRIRRRQALSHLDELIAAAKGATPEQLQDIRRGLDG